MSELGLTGLNSGGQMSFGSVQYSGRIPQTTATSPEIWGFNLKYGTLEPEIWGFHLRYRASI